MFDNVRIIESEFTKSIGIAGKNGQVYGESIPSSSGVEVTGPCPEDFALNVYFEESGNDYWLSPKFVEFVDNGAGTEIVVGNIKSIRQADGSWKEYKLKKWWQFWL